MSGQTGLPKDASVVMVWRRDAENSMNFVAKRDEAEAFSKKVFEKEVLSGVSQAEHGLEAILSTDHQDEAITLQTYPTPDGRRTNVTIRRGDVVMLAVDRDTGLLGLGLN